MSFFVKITFWTRSEKSKNPSLLAKIKYIVRKYIGVVDISLGSMKNHIWLYQNLRKIEKMTNFYIFSSSGHHLWV
jgi:hypothetical protein